MGNALDGKGLSPLDVHILSFLNLGEVPSRGRTDRSPSLAVLGENDDRNLFLSRGYSSLSSRHDLMHRSTFPYAF